MIAEFAHSCAGGGDIVVAGSTSLCGAGFGSTKSAGATKKRGAA